MRPSKVSPEEARDRYWINNFHDEMSTWLIYHWKDKLMDLEGFEQRIPDWSRGTMPLTERYQAYRKAYEDNWGEFIEEPKSAQPVGGFKTKLGLRRLKNTDESHPTNYFPLKKNRKYHLHQVAEHGTYIFDMVFTHGGQFTYLFGIELNTRYVFAVLLNKGKSNNRTIRDKAKATDSYLKALRNLIRDGMDIRYILSDAEPAFTSKEAKTFYNRRNIVHKPVGFLNANYQEETKQPYHTSLGILDRAVRTIRDMAYNIGITDDNITPNVMDRLIREYNNTYHKTLSKYARFNVTPFQAHLIGILEDKICNRIRADNWCVMNSDDFYLPPGTPVKVYNSPLNNPGEKKRRTVIHPGKYEVVDFENCRYIVRDEESPHAIPFEVPRFRIDPL